jgi:hypothetical protein
MGKDEQMAIRRRAARVLALAALAALAGGFGLGPAVLPASATASVFTVAGAQYSATTVSPSGLVTQPLTLTVHVIASPALQTWNYYLTAVVGPTNGGPGYNLFVNMTLASGTGSDGYWTGTLAVPSTASGTRTLTAVQECPYPYCTVTVNHPVSGMPTITVVGTHVPVLSAGQSPAVTPFDSSLFVIKGRVTDSATGAGIPGARVGHGVEIGCVPDPGFGFDNTVTDSLGYYSFAVSAQAALFAKDQHNCLVIRGGIQSDGSEQLVLDRAFLVTTNQVLLSAVPARTVVPIGTAVQVIGNVAHASNPCTVELQQLTGATAWRPVSYWQMRPGGRYTLLARPVVLGVNIYRTYVPGCGGWGPYTSAPFAITAALIPVSVSALPARTPVPPGTVVQVNGTVSFAPYRCPVVLQQLTGATQWRGKSLAEVRPSGRYTLLAAPSPGANTYRTLFPMCGTWAQSTSPAFTITAT